MRTGERRQDIRGADDIDFIERTKEEEDRPESPPPQSTDADDGAATVATVAMINSRTKQ